MRPFDRRRAAAAATTRAAACGLAVVVLSTLSACVDRSGDRPVGGETAAAAAAAAAVPTASAPVSAVPAQSASADSVGVLSPPPEGDRSAISVFLHGGVADVVVTDPQGRRLGADPATQRTYAEIPRGSSSIEYPESDEEPDESDSAGTQAATGADSGAGPADTGDAPVREIMIMAPAPGTYTLTVVGTRVGAYDLDVGTVARDAMSSGDAHVAGARATPRTVHRYRFTFDPASRQPKAVALARLP